MANTLEMHQFSDREIFYFRQRQKNRFFQSVIAHFAQQAESRGLTKRDIATLLDKDPSQITRWLSGPSNWTMDTISDLLLAMHAELDTRIVPLDAGASDGENVLLFTEPVKEESQLNDPDALKVKWA